MAAMFAATADIQTIHLALIDGGWIWFKTTSFFEVVKHEKVRT